MIANTGLLGTFGMLAVVVGTSMVVHMTPPDNTVAKYGALMLFNTAIGLTLSPLVVLGGPLLARAAAMTAGIVGSLAVVAANSPSDKFLWMAGPLAMGLGAVFVASIGAAFLPAGGAVAGVMHKVRRKKKKERYIYGDVEEGSTSRRAGRKRGRRRKEMERRLNSISRETERDRNKDRETQTEPETDTGRRTETQTQRQEQREG